MLATFASAGVTLLALLLALGTALTWLVPTRGTLFEFSKAEVQFLFPAPVRRRQLLLHRLMRSQLGLLFASVVPALLVPRGAGITRVRLAISVWIILVTMRLVSTGTALARPRLNHPDRRTRFMARVAPCRHLRRHCRVRHRSGTRVRSHTELALPGLHRTRERDRSFGSRRPAAVAVCRAGRAPLRHRSAALRHRAGRCASRADAVRRVGVRERRGVRGRVRRGGRGPRATVTGASRESTASGRPRSSCSRPDVRSWRLCGRRQRRRSGW